MNPSNPLLFAAHIIDRFPCWSFLLKTRDEKEWILLMLEFVNLGILTPSFIKNKTKTLACD